VIRGAIVTRILVGLNVLIYLITVAQGGGINDPGGPLFNKWLLYGPFVANGDWWRLLTACFLHVGIWHIAVNMYALWWLGSVVEGAIGSLRFALLYIGSGLEAIYEETRMKRLRTYFGSLIAPWMAAGRSYEVEYQSGLLPHFMASSDVILLHLLADTGNKNKHLRSREEFLPLTDVQARVRVPQGRTVKSASLLRSGAAVPVKVRDGWLDVAIPRVLIHEAVKVELARFGAVLVEVKIHVARHWKARLAATRRVIIAGDGNILERTILRGFGRGK